MLPEAALYRLAGPYEENSPSPLPASTKNGRGFFSLTARSFPPSSPVALDIISVSMGRRKAARVPQGERRGVIVPRAPQAWTGMNPCDWAPRRKRALQ